MALPDKHAGEPTSELDPELWDKYMDAKRAAAGWEAIADEYRKQLEEQVGNAYAGTIDGRKVLTYRPGNTYATKRIREEYPDLTEHYMVRKITQELDMKQFAARHPEIAELYRVRSFREVGTNE